MPKLGGWVWPTVCVAWLHQSIKLGLSGMDEGTAESVKLKLGRNFYSKLETSILCQFEN